MRRAISIAVVCSMIILAGVAASTAPKADERLKGAFRRPAVNGWTFVHLEGTAAQIGYQHGYLLAAEIQDLYFFGRRRKMFCGLTWSRNIVRRCRELSTE